MLTDDWFAAIDRGVEFPDGHFEALLLENDNWRNPAPLIKPFSGGLCYCERLRAMTDATVLKGFYFVADLEKRLAEVAMQRHLEAYRDSLLSVAVMENLNEEAASLRAASIRFEPDYAAFDSLFGGETKTPWSDIPDALSDVFFDKIFEKDRNLRLIKEATLQLTMSKELTMWVMEPLVRTGLDLRPGYDIAMGGGLVAVLTQEIVCHIQDF